MSSDEPTIGGGDPHKISTGMLLSLGAVVLSVGGSVGVSALVKGEVIDLDTFWQVSAYMTSAIGGAAGGALYVKRGR